MGRNSSALTAKKPAKARIGSTAAASLPASGLALEKCNLALKQWADLWSAPWLLNDIAINFSTRLSTSLGRCRPYSKTISLNTNLLTGDKSELLLEVLCHEAAHIVNFVHHGRTVKPHGKEWQALVTAAGYKPGPRIVVKSQDTTTKTRKSTVVYEHRCPICQNAWYSRRPIKRWKCGSCLASGLSGDLIIIKQKRNSGEQNES